MLEVGRVTAPAPGTFLSWNRAHFGAWCIVSAPLILGLDVTDTAKLEPILDVIGNQAAIKVNQDWAGHPGMLVENIVPPPQPFKPGGIVVPSSSAGDFNTAGGAGAATGPADKDTSGANLRTGSPGGIGTIRIGSGIIGKGHSITEISMSFRYIAGYTPAAGHAKKASVVKLLVLDLASSQVLATPWTSEPLGNYSYDHFTGYSPPVKVHATGLSVSTNSAVILALEVENNERNLQIPIDDKAMGFNIHVNWDQMAVNESAGYTDSRGAFLRVAMTPSAPFGSGQLWAKPQPQGAMAVLLINHSPTTISNYSIALSKLNLTEASYSVRDIWTSKSLGTIDDVLKIVAPAYDSAFMMLSPGRYTATQHSRSS